MVKMVGQVVKLISEGEGGKSSETRVTVVQVKGMVKFKVRVRMKMVKVMKVKMVREGGFC